ncbi:transposase [Streptomyces sp. NPDC005525]|uniref:transposase n=1 Tax=Streptomyces sp. NPDC005525 TaxID=3364720 RepID=UPI0036950002
MSIVLTPGNVNDATAFGQVLDGICVPRASWGRPRTTPERGLGDKAYSSRAICRLLRRRSIVATIPERRDQAANPPTARGPRRQTTHLRQGRLPRPQRSRSMLCPSQALRAIATRFDTLADRYRAGVVLASLIPWPREPAR